MIEEDFFAAWLGHRGATDHQRVELFYPEPEGDKAPHPVGWRCLECGKSAGEVPE